MAIDTINIIDTTIEEHELLIKAGGEIREFGATEKKCPRCENNIVVDIIGTSKTSYKIRCRTENCISASFKGM